MEGITTSFQMAEIQECEQTSLESECPSLINAEKLFVE